MKKIYLLFSLSLVLQGLFAQQGSPLLTHYAESRKVENQSWAICQDEDNIMLFAYRKGILAFDGKDWTTIRTPVIPYAMQKNPYDGNIYIGGDNNYGYLEKNDASTYEYVSLSGDSAGTGAITRIIFSDSLAWFYSDQTTSRYNLSVGICELQLKSKPDHPFTGMFLTPEKTYINVLGEGLYRLESDTLFPIVTGYLTEETEILFSLPYNDERVLVGLSNGDISLFDGIKYYDYEVKDEGYLKNNILSEGITLGDTAYAFSTLDGGALVIEKLSGDIFFTINNKNQLPDDEVYAIGKDNTGGLWLSHQYGLTRADLHLPVANYSIFPGLDGNLTSALRHNDELFVSTSEGVYYLTEVKSYDEVQIYTRIPVETVSPEEAAEEEEQKSGRKNIFTRIFGKITGRQQREEEAEPEEPATATPETRVTRRTVSKLKSINHVYKKVEGLNEKCRQLVSTPEGLLAATNRGLFVIKDHKAEILEDRRYINSITWKPFDSRYYVSANDGYFAAEYENNEWVTDILDTRFYNTVYSVVAEDNNTLWMGGDDVAYRVELGNEEDGVEYFNYSVKNEFPQRYMVDMVNDSVILYTETGIYYFNEENDEFSYYTNGRDTGEDRADLILPLANFPLLKYDNDWLSKGKKEDMDESELSLLKLFDEVVSVTSEKDNLWVISDDNLLYGIDRKRSAEITPSISILIKNISNEKGVSFNLADIKFRRGDDVIIFDIIAPAYLKANTNQYQYYIGKQMTDWSPWSTFTHYEKTITKQGDYTLQVRAKDLWENISEPVSVDFTIKAPFTETALFYILVGIVLLALLITVVRFREKQLHHKNRILEEKVRERTAEIAAQKEEITSSIEYASRIQLAMLPMEELFRNVFSDYFIFFKPRDIVSGDFYWINEDDKSIFFTVGDCTGHGVPGAFMSTLGISTLNEITANNRSLQANKVLDLLRKKIMESLHQTGKEGEAADGMDIAFCILDKNRKTLQFAGAYNPLVIFQNGELKEYKADRMPIGIHYGDAVPFTNYVINVKKGDTIYIFSDGYADQFGGPEGAKYKKANLKRLLTDIQYRPMVEQRNILDTELAKWQGSLAQIDDITIIGVRI